MSMWQTDVPLDSEQRAESEEAESLQTGTRVICVLQSVVMTGILDDVRTVIHSVVKTAYVAIMI